MANEEVNQLLIGVGIEGMDEVLSVVDRIKSAFGSLDDISMGGSNAGAVDTDRLSQVTDQIAKIRSLIDGALGGGPAGAGGAPFELTGFQKALNGLQVAANNQAKAHEAIAAAGDDPEKHKAALDQLARAQNQASDAYKKLSAAVEPYYEASRANMAEITGAQERYAGALNAAANETRAAAASTHGSFMSEVGRGLKPDTMSWGQELGQGLRWGVLYGGIYRAAGAVQQLFVDAWDQAKEFQSGIAQMAIATGQSNSALNSLGQTLMDTAVAAAQNPVEGLQVGARSIGLFGATNVTGGPVSPQLAQQQNYIAQTAAQAVSQMALLTGKQPTELLNNMAAASNDMGMGVGGLSTLSDYDVYFTRMFGGSRGDTLPAMARAGALGQQAGFNAAQLSAMAADIAARTGQGGDTTGGFLAQILAKGDSTAVAKLAASLGINTTGSVSTILTGLANAYETGSSKQRDAIANAAGGTFGGEGRNAAAAMFDDWRRIMGGAQSAQGGAAQGAAAHAAATELSTLGGHTKELAADFKELSANIGESGILLPLEGVILGLDDLVKGINSVLQPFDALPGAIRLTIEGLAALAIASKVVAATEGEGALAGFASKVPGLGGWMKAYRSGGSSALLENPAAAALLPEGEVAAGAGGLGALGSAIGASAIAVAPWVAAAGGIYALAAIANGASAMTNAINNTSAVIGNADLTTAAGVQSAASTAAQQSINDRHAGVSIFGMQLTNDNADARMLDRWVKFLNDSLAPSLKTAGNGNAQGGLGQVDLSGGASTVTTSLKNMTQSGYTAGEMIDRLNAAIIGMATASGRARLAMETPLNPNVVSRSFEQALMQGKVLKPGGGTGAVRVGDRAVSGYYTNDAGFWGSDSNVTSTSAQQHIARAFDPTKFAGQVRDAMTGLGVTNIGDLTSANITSLANTLTPQISHGSVTDKNVTAQIRQWILAYLRGEVTNAKDQIDQASAIGGTDAEMVMQQVFTATKTQAALLNKNDFAGQIKLYASQLGSALKLGQHDPTSQMMLDIQNARNQLVEAQVARLEALRKVADQGAVGTAGQMAVDDNSARAEIDAFVKGGSSNTDDLANIIATGSNTAKAYARQAIEKEIAQIKAAMTAEADANRLAAEISTSLSTFASAVDNSGLGLLSPGLGNALRGLAGTEKPGKSKYAAALAAQQKLLDSIQFDPINSSFTQQSLSGGTAAQVAAAAATAQAVAGGGSISKAQAAIQTASADMAAAVRGSMQYYQALGQYYQAQRDLANAIQSNSNNVWMLHHDMTNPVVAAQAQLLAARAQLATDQRLHSNSDVINTDKLAVEKDQNALQAAAFSQRLQDVQTNEQIGRISQAAYLQYLQSEHNRLVAIRNKTRQQTDELNQVDTLIYQAMQQMQGQFNMGNIKLPTVYQVRRYIQEQAAVAAGQMSASQTVTQQGTTIYINGADTGAVQKIISQTVGRPLAVVNSGPRRF